MHKVIITAQDAWKIQLMVATIILLDLELLRVYVGTS